MVSLEQLNVQVAVLPLLGGNVVIDSFVLDKPVINLEVDRQGRPNWVFTPASGAGAGASALDEPCALEEPGSVLTRLPSLAAGRHVESAADDEGPAALEDAAPPAVTSIA